MVDFLTLIPLLLNNCKITPIKSCLCLIHCYPCQKVKYSKRFSFSLQKLGFLSNPLTLQYFPLLLALSILQGVCSTLSGVLAVPKTQHRGNNRADDPNCSEGGAIGLMTLIASRGNNRADDPNCSEGGAIGLMTLIASRGTYLRKACPGATYRGPAPVDPGNSKGRWLRRSGYDRIKDIKSDQIRIAQ